MNTTLDLIRAKDPCTNGWKKLLKYLGKTTSDSEPLSLLTILESNGLDDALWCLRATPDSDSKARLFAVFCARQVQHLNPDPRVAAAIDTAEAFALGKATKEELKAARSAARSAAYDAACAADAARSAAYDASSDAAYDAAYAASDAAYDAAYAAYAASDAASAARSAAYDAAYDAAYAASDAASAAAYAAYSAASSAAYAAYDATQQAQAEYFKELFK